MEHLQNSPRHQTFQIGQQVITTGLLLFAGELGFGEGNLYSCTLGTDGFGYFFKKRTKAGSCSASSALGANYLSQQL